MFGVGMILSGTLALMPSMMQVLMNYPVFDEKHCDYRADPARRHHPTGLTIACSSWSGSLPLLLLVRVPRRQPMTAAADD
jgi:hypothetical protein